MSGHDIETGVVLVVEDDPADQDLARRALEDSPTRTLVKMVSDGEQAMDYLLRRGEFTNPADSPRPDLILLDINMPRMSGSQVLQALQQEPDLRRIPVIMLTTSAADGDVDHCYELGCRSYIVKPVTLDGYVAAIEQLNLYWFRLVKLPVRMAPVGV